MRYTQGDEGEMIDDTKKGGIRFSAQITLGSIVSMIGICVTLVTCYANFRSRLDVIEIRQADFAAKINEINARLTIVGETVNRLQDSNTRLQVIVEERFRKP